MKHKIKSRLLVPVLCMGIFFLPVRAYAQAQADGALPVTGSAISDILAEAENGTVSVETPDDKAGEEHSGAEAMPEDAAESEPHPFTPEGQASVTDHATDEDGKEFYTFTTPDENVFYLVIDNQRENENVYFLNAVTEEDLAALAEKSADGDMESGDILPEAAVCTCMEKCEAGLVNVDCAVCKNDLEGCTGKEAEPEEEAEAEEGEPETSEQKGSGGSMIFALLAVLAVGGAGYYFKIYRPKRELDDAEDLDDLLGDGEEPEVNEDAETEEEQETEMEAEAERALYDDYPGDDYLDDEPVQEESEQIDG